MSNFEPLVEELGPVEEVAQGGMIPGLPDPFCSSFSFDTIEWLNCWDRPVG